ncbi:efflux RND transporter periplasmic adaptor subunit [bacterium]|nr:efflux RND transporter periplasmic adaptor subunit [bacterium]
MKYILALSILIMFGIDGCSNKESTGDAKENTKEVYYCPMHPEVTSEKPGVCPICNMDLVKKVDEKKATMEDMPGMINLTVQKQVMANVSTVKIQKEQFSKELVSYSYLDFAEPNRRFISARFNGRIEKLLVDKTGDYVSRGQPLFEIYSPDLLEAQNEYLIALENTASIRKASLNDAANTNILVKSSRKRLELYGLTHEQIATLDSTRVLQYTMTYYSPISGTVIEKKIQEGAYVNEGTLLYEIADMSTLWGIAEVYEKDLSLIKVGNKVKLRLPAYPDDTFDGTVSLIYPVVNSQTRTVKVRSEFSNMNHKLSPQMYGEIIIKKDLGKQLVISQDAVLFTGKRQIVWVKTAEDHFESKEVNLGIKNNGKYQVLSGLKEGDEVAVTGGFLIDSESQLRSGKTTGHQHEGMKMEEVIKEPKKELKESEAHKH